MPSSMMRNQSIKLKTKIKSPFFVGVEKRETKKRKKEKRKSFFVR